MAFRDKSAFVFMLNWTNICISAVCGSHGAITFHSQEMASDVKSPVAATDVPGDSGRLGLGCYPCRPGQPEWQLHSVNRSALSEHFRKWDHSSRQGEYLFLCGAGYFIATDSTRHFRSWQSSLGSFKMHFFLFLLHPSHVGPWFPEQGWNSHSSCIGKWSLNYWTTREVPKMPSLIVLQTHA